MEALILPAASLVSVALLLGWCAGASRAGTLERNALIGIRTRATMASDAAWAAGHHAAEPALRAAAWACGAAGLVGTVLAIVGTWLAGVAVGAGYGALLVMLVLATARASRAARATSS
ncbi:MAG: SdpI family protein [Aeromicrobium sp.]|uniref:SdpI family protein n=1 Tax=Aeromicrobium sp. TaxID=1871063 RepID=UPI002612528F|nr:SdpI family protein [Aeromicrobium sp.]MDF1705848.1 SdpI family protein [Aeromicrobium sp.]